MSDKKPESVHEFPLTANSAKRIINDLANNHTARVKFGKHARERMQQRRVTNMQVFHVLGSRHSRVTEEPHQTPAADPSAFIVTVMVK